MGQTITALAALAIGALGGYSALFWMSPEDYFPKAKPKSVHLEMYSEMLGEWEPVAVAHGYYSNDEACREIIEGLTIVSHKNGRGVRTYRCVP